MSVTKVSIGHGYKIEVNNKNLRRANTALAKAERDRTMPRKKKYAISNAFALEAVAVADKFGSLEAAALVGVDCKTLRFLRQRLRRDGLYHAKPRGRLTADDYWPLLAARLLAQHDACVRADSGAGKSAAIPQTQP